MRIFYLVLFFLTLINFSGIPDVVSGIFVDDYTLLSISDEAEEKQSEKEKDGKEKEEREEENVKESLMNDSGFPVLGGPGRNLSLHNGILIESGYSPEDHSPPPESV